MKRENPILLSLAALTLFSFTAGSSAWAQNPQQYPPPQYPPPQYPQQPPQQPQQPQYPPQRPPQQPQQPQQPYPPGYPAPGYPAPTPAYPPQYPPRPAPQSPTPAYPPQQPVPAYPPGYPAPAPQYPPQGPSYPPQPVPSTQPYPQQQGYQPPPVYPQQPGYPAPGYDVSAALRPGAQEHLGFFIRLLGGPNYISSGFSTMGVKASVSGFGGFFDFAVGSAVAQNVVIYGEATMYSLLSGSIKVTGNNGTTAEADTTDNGVSIGLGPGAAYYLMPINLYFGGSLQVNFLRGDLYKSGVDYPDIGLAFNGDVGKEFFVSDDWGVGANLRLTYARNSFQSVTYNTFALALCFSATFN